MATHSSILVWRIPWTEEPGGLQSMGSQRAGQDWATNTELWKINWIVWSQCLGYVQNLPQLGKCEFFILPPSMHLFPLSYWIPWYFAVTRSSENWIGARKNIVLWTNPRDVEQILIYQIFKIHKIRAEHSVIGSCAITLIGVGKYFHLSYVFHVNMLFD